MRYIEVTDAEVNRTVLIPVSRILRVYQEDFENHSPALIYVHGDRKPVLTLQSYRDIKEKISQAVEE